MPSTKKLGVRTLDQESIILIPDLTLEEGHGPARLQGPGLYDDLLANLGGLHVGQAHVDTDAGSKLILGCGQGQGRHRVN